ncbi:Co2+/Mg2+ efflux protein ApaG [Rhodothalassium salexigens]|uniref:Co2+/Mg2+ efflux protein ApaG n=1 Tax=Rhodothalassium salexigens TaxID=1086 RepID=UPI001912A760|nr:Co2+/Mg2+ efflux protein ApaG [Rhodothalassium salexigens]
MDTVMSYEATTHAIVVEVTPFFLDDESDPEDHRYVWAYQVRIENQRGGTVQLLRRSWRITDALGRTHEVDGEGVVGEQPMIAPGDCFEYTSGAPLATPSGLMQGSYTMADHDGRPFEVTIPAFSLDSPYEARLVN